MFGSNSGFSASLDLSTLNGSNGFIINGFAGGDLSGYSVSSAGDVNGDGFDDLIIGATYADPNGSGSGQSYVVFGKSTGFSASLDLSTLNGSNGFILNGIAAFDLSGFSVSSAGDVNGDGFDDLIIGAKYADPNGSGSGQSYVVFGKSTGFSATLNLSTLNGSNGFILNGIAANNQSGISVSSAGDVNGDGFDDLIIGAKYGAYFRGQSYVVFGKSTGFSASLDLSTLNGSNGFAINGIAPGNRTGFSVSSAGDVNGDGFDDLIIGANGASPSGQSYVVFGKSTGFSATLNLSTLNGSNGFALNGIARGDSSGYSVSDAGDVNGDGIDDLIIGATDALSYSGQSYVVFGNRAPGLDLNGSNGSGINFSTSKAATPVSIVDSDFTLSDNNTTLAGVTIAITNLLNGTAESLAATAVGNITATYNTTRGILTLSGTDTVANYRQVLASLTYNNTATSPNTTNRTIEFVVDDGQAFSNASAVATTTLAFNVNQPPIAVDDTLSTDEDTILNANVLIANPTTPDSDPNNDTLTVTQVNGNTAGIGNQITLTNGALLTLNSNGTFNYNPNGQFESLAAATTDSDSFTYTISDGNGGISTATVNLTINGVNDVAAIAGTATKSVTEDATTPNLTATGSLTVTDVDTNESVFNTTVTSATGNLGSLSITNAGAYSYSVANSAVQFLGAGQTKAETFTVKSVDGTATQNIVVTINGVNDAATITGTATKSVTEDATTPNLTATGSLTVTDVDTNESVFNTTVTSATGNLGSLSITNAGAYSYSVANSAVQFLGAGQTKAETFTVKSVDGTATQNIVVTINGVNDVATITGTATKSVTEDATTPNLTATGSLTVTDVDTNESVFNTTVTSATGNLGSLSITSAGAYSYSVANSAVQFLGAGQTKAETFTVKSVDGTATQNIVVTINGVNDAAAIAGTATKSVTEDATTPNLTATGSLTVTDVDTNESVFNTTVTSATGNLGSLSITNAGAYSYSVANSAVQFLGAGQTKAETFTVKSVDGTATQNIVVTINGVNDVAAIAGTATKSVTEDATTPNLTATGSLTVTDVDTNQSIFNTTVTSATGNLGSLSITSAGAYSYSVANSAVQFLGAGQTKAETFTVKSVDGTATQNIVVTINGVNDAATITGTATKSVTEDATTPNLTATGSLTVTDVDTNESLFNTTVTSATGNLGSLSITSAGAYSYSIANSAVQFLGAGQTKAETFTVKSVDGTATQNVVVTINGVNDAPIANNNSGIGFSTDEDNAFTTANVLTNDTDVDSSDVLTVTNLNTTGTLGLVTNNSNGTFSYNPNRAFESLNNGQTATDSFTYTVSDGKGGTNTATVTVNIAGVTDVPITIQAESLTNITGYRIENNAIAEGGSMLTLINGSANEVGTATFTFNGPSGLYNLIIGTFDENDGQSTFTLTQQGNAVGSILLNQDFNSDAPSQNTKVERLLGSNLTITNGNSFTITGFENQGEAARLDFIRFVPVGLAGTPVAVNDSATTAFNTAVSIPVSTLLANDTDPNGDSLRITSVSGVANGNAILNNNGTANNTADDFVLFTPITGFTGNGSFNYTLSDGSLTATATVTVAVGANIVGGTGNDSINGGAGNDSISGGNGNDSINGGAGNDSITGDNGNDTINGGAGNDSITGDNGNDTINGGAGNDRLYGGNGNDLLYGGLGSDILTGDNGNDIFAFAAGEGTDTITDFSKGSDLIGLYNGLSFGQLSFSSSNILVTSTNEILATLTGVNTTTLTAANFVTL